MSVCVCLCASVSASMKTHVETETSKAITNSRIASNMDGNSFAIPSNCSGGPTESCENSDFDSESCEPERKPKLSVDCFFFFFFAFLFVVFFLKQR